LGRSRFATSTKKTEAPNRNVEIPLSTKRWNNLRFATSERKISTKNEEEGSSSEDENLTVSLKDIARESLRKKPICSSIKENSGEADDYDFNDGWLVEDDIIEWEEEEEEEEGEEDGEEEEEEEDEEEEEGGEVKREEVNCKVECGCHEISDSCCPVGSLAESDFSIPTSLRVTVTTISTQKLARVPTLVSKAIGNKELSVLRDGAPHPVTGLVFIREEHFPQPSRFRNRSHREQLTASLYEEYNTRVFGGKLPPMLFTPRAPHPTNERVAENAQFLPVEWRGRLVKTAGLTFMSRRAPTHGPQAGDAGSTYCARIALSVKVLDTPLKLAQTLLHEMCHAAQWLVDHTQRPPHGAVFQKWARAGTAAYPKRPVTVCHNYNIETKFRFQCTSAGCGVVVGRHSKSINSGVDCCKTCGRGTMVLLSEGSASDFRKAERLEKGKTPSKYLEFIERERPVLLRETGGTLGPREVMKELARRWGIEKGRNMGGDAPASGALLDLTELLQGVHI